MCAEGSNEKTELQSGSHFVMWLKTIRYLHYSGYTFITQDIPGAVLAQLAIVHGFLSEGSPVWSSVTSMSASTFLSSV